MFENHRKLLKEFHKAFDDFIHEYQFSKIFGNPYPQTHNQTHLADWFVNIM